MELSPPILRIFLFDPVPFESAQKSDDGPEYKKGNPYESRSVDPLIDGFEVDPDHDAQNESHQGVLKHRILDGIPVPIPSVQGIFHVTSPPPARKLE
jgi:hypothetical protein